MNARRPVIIAVLAVALTGLLGANAAKDVSPEKGGEQRENAFWIKTKLPEDLLAGRLNVTSVAKTPRMPLPKRSPRKRNRTALLVR
ncbi:MAG: hypothetical protein QNJ62_01750 [Methyloceanibacter sp.]|nr:hypothetical protein [Methyloceanibacter sp.]